MKEDTPSHPPFRRQYHSERLAIVTFSGILIFYRVVGSLPQGSHPFLDKVRACQPELLPFVVLAILLYLLYRLFAEWCILPARLRSMPAVRFDFRVTMAIGLTAALAVVWPYAKYTGFTYVSTLHAIMFVLLGACHGVVLHTVVVMPFLVRPTRYARTVCLPRVPATIRARTGMIAVLLFLWCFLLLTSRVLAAPLRDWWVLFFSLGTLAYFAKFLLAMPRLNRLQDLPELFRRYLSTLRQTVDFLDAALMLDGQIQRLPITAPPICQAAHSGDVETVARLLECQEDPDAFGHWGWTPLLHASAEGHGDVVQLLLSRGADPNVANFFGRTPLMFAAKYAFVDIASVLLSAGADPNAKALYDGRTALMDAAESGCGPLIRKLLSAKANPHIKDHCGMSALDYASANRRGDCAAILRQELLKSAPLEFGSQSMGMKSFSVDSRQYRPSHASKWVTEIKATMERERRALTSAQNAYLPETERTLLDVRSTYSKLGALDHRARADMLLGRLYMMSGKHEQAIPVLDQAADYRVWLDSDDVPHVAFMLGWCHMQLGHIPEGISHFRRALKGYRNMSSTECAASVLNNLGILYGHRGWPRFSRHYYRRALSLHEVTGDKGEQANTLINIGNSYSRYDKELKARCYYERAAAIATDAGNLVLTAHAEHSLGSTYLPGPRGKDRVVHHRDVNLLDLDAAEKWFLSSLKHAWTARHLGHCIAATRLLATVALLREDKNEASILYACARHLLRESDPRGRSVDTGLNQIIAQLAEAGFRARESTVKARLKQWERRFRS